MMDLDLASGLYGNQDSIELIPLGPRRVLVDLERFTSRPIPWFVLAGVTASLLLAICEILVSWAWPHLSSSNISCYHHSNTLSSL